MATNDDIQSPSSAHAISPSQISTPHMHLEIVLERRPFPLVTRRYRYRSVCKLQQCCGSHSVTQYAHTPIFFQRDRLLSRNTLLNGPSTTRIITTDINARWYSYHQALIPRLQQLLSHQEHECAAVPATSSIDIYNSQQDLNQQNLHLDRQCKSTNGDPSTKPSLTSAKQAHRTIETAEVGRFEHRLRRETSPRKVAPG